MRVCVLQGKKAKRKARERLLDEAKRLASLQKLRELKAAGVDVTKRKRKRQEGVDYGAEIPFEKRAPAGFFDTSGDDVTYATAKAKETAEFKVTLLNKIEGERAYDREARAKANDKARMKRLTASHLPEVLAAETEADPLNVRKRAKLSLPAPQLSEGDLEELVRLGQRAADEDGGASLLLTDADGEGQSVVTAGLLGNGNGSSVGGGAGGLAAALAAIRSGTFGGSGASTVTASGRTAMPSRDALLEEARNQLRENAAPTPLLGGENAPLAAGTGYEGVTPASGRGRLGGAAPTPSVLGGAGGGGTVINGGGATPSVYHHRGGAGGTVIGGGSSGASVAAGGGLAALLPRPTRDGLGINQSSVAASEVGGGVSSVQQQQQQAARRRAAPASASSSSAAAAAAPAGDDEDADADGTDNDAADVASVAGTDVDVGDSASVVMGGGGRSGGKSTALAGGRRGGLSVGSVAGGGTNNASLLFGLASLPAPRNQYEVVAPPQEEDEGDDDDVDMADGAVRTVVRSSSSGSGAGGIGGGRGTSAVVEDAGEEAERRAAAEAAAAAAEFRSRSAALQHDPSLPRPLVIDEDALAPPTGASAIARGDYAGFAESLIRDEMVTLLKGDAFKYPVSGRNEHCSASTVTYLYCCLCSLI